MIDWAVRHELEDTPPCDSTDGESKRYIESRGDHSKRISEINVRNVSIEAVSAWKFLLELGAVQQTEL